MDTGSIIAILVSCVSMAGVIATAVFNARRDRRESDGGREKEHESIRRPLVASHEKLEARMNGIVSDKETAHRVLHERINGVEKDVGHIRLSVQEIAINLKHFMTSQKLPYQQLSED